MRYTVEELARAVDGEVFDVEESATVTGVSTDSRHVKTGDAFVAIKGDKFDGHDFTGSAIVNGAVVCIVERGRRYYGLPRIEVADTLIALGHLAKFHRVRTAPHAKAIGITGSVGKTTTKELIALVLGRKFNVTKSPKSFNNAVGLPLTLLKVSETTEFIISEVGTNHPGEIAYLAARLRPDVAVLTRIGYAHIGFFGSTKAIAHEKADLFRILPSGGLAVRNAESPHIDVFKKSIPEGVKVMTYGLCKSVDVPAEAVEPLGFNITKFRALGVDFKVNLPLSLIENALAAIAVGHALGIPVEEIRDALLEFKGMPMRMEITEIEGVTIVNDAYNANPDSMTALFRTFSAHPNKDRLIFVLGDMLELGDFSEQLHREVGRAFVDAGFKRLVAVGKQARFIAEEAMLGGAKVFYFEKVDDVADLLVAMLRQGDTLVLKASRRMQLEKIVEELKNALPSALSA